MLTPRLNAILLAGDRHSSVPLKNENKGFLEINGIPIFIYVLRALRQSAYICDVIVVGPAGRIEAALQQHAVRREAGGAVRVVEQHESMLENVMVSYVVSLGLDESVPFKSLRGSEYERVPVLIAPCDIPLLMPHEVDEFCVRSNLFEYDYAVGVTSEKVLSRYYPTPGKHGIRMTYMHLREDLLRQNNLHMACPLAFKNLDHIEKMYELRHQTQIANIFRMLSLLLVSGWHLLRGVPIFIMMQLSLHYDRRGHLALSNWLRSKASLCRLEERISNALGARIQVIYTHFGGAALDADNEFDLTVIETRYEEWMHAQQQLLSSDSETLQDAVVSN